MLLWGRCMVEILCAKVYSVEGEAVWCHCRPLSAISHHQTLPNTVWRLMQAGLAAHIHNPHVLPPPLLRCAVGVPLSGPLVRR